jgi:hypothetical protein
VKSWARAVMAKRIFSIYYTAAKSKQTPKTYTRIYIIDICTP